MKKELNPLVQKAFLGFASGVMVAASVWSLLIPAMDMCEDMGRFSFVPAAAGLLHGMEAFNTSPRHDNGNEKTQNILMEHPDLIATAGSDSHRAERCV